MDYITVLNETFKVLEKFFGDRLEDSIDILVFLIICSINNPVRKSDVIEALELRLFKNLKENIIDKINNIEIKDPKFANFNLNSEKIIEESLNRLISKKLVIKKRILYLENNNICKPNITYGLPRKDHLKKILEQLLENKNISYEKFIKEVIQKLDHLAKKPSLNNWQPVDGISIKDGEFVIIYNKRKQYKIKPNKKFYTYNNMTVALNELSSIGDEIIKKGGNLKIASTAGGWIIKSSKSLIEDKLKNDYRVEVLIGELPLSKFYCYEEWKEYRNEFKKLKVKISKFRTNKLKLYIRPLGKTYFNMTISTTTNEAIYYERDVPSHKLKHPCYINDKASVDNLIKIFNNQKKWSIFYKIKKLLLFLKSIDWRELFIQLILTGFILNRIYKIIENFPNIKFINIIELLVGFIIVIIIHIIFNYFIKME